MFGDLKFAVETIVDLWQVTEVSGRGARISILGRAIANAIFGTA